jgi:hypothetical protein
VKRLIGNRFNAEIDVGVPGIEIGTQHKYAYDRFQFWSPHVQVRSREGF